MPNRIRPMVREVLGFCSEHAVDVRFKDGLLRWDFGCGDWYCLCDLIELRVLREDLHDAVPVDAEHVDEGIRVPEICDCLIELCDKFAAALWDFSLVDGARCVCVRNPLSEFRERAEAGEFDKIDDGEYEKRLVKAEAMADYCSGYYLAPFSLIALTFLIERRGHLELEELPEESSEEVVNLADKMDPNEIPIMAGEGIPKGTERDVEQKAKADMRDAKRFAGGQLAPSDLFCHAGVVDTYNKHIIQAFLECRSAFANDPNFRVRNNSLYSSDNKVEYIVDEAFDDTCSSGDSRESEVSALGRYRVTQTFVRMLSNMETWQGIADGKFDAVMARLLAE